MNNAKTLEVQKLRNLRLQLPVSWREAAGILVRKKGLSPLQYQKKIRKEWNLRLRKITGDFTTHGA